MVIVLFALLFTTIVVAASYIASSASSERHNEENSAPDASLRILTSEDEGEAVDVKILLNDFRKHFLTTSKAKRDKAYSDFYANCGKLVARYIGYKVEMDEYDDLVALLPIMRKAVDETRNKLS